MEQNPHFFRLGELKEKQVVNSADGSILGHVCDLELDLSVFGVRALILPGEAGLHLFSKKEEIRISPEQIEKIGEDIILVNSGVLLKKSAR